MSESDLHITVVDIPDEELERLREKMPFRPFDIDLWLVDTENKVIGKVRWVSRTDYRTISVVPHPDEADNEHLNEIFSDWVIQMVGLKYRHIDGKPWIDPGWDETLWHGTRLVGDDKFYLKHKRWPAIGDTIDY